jgi:hypothetical protein
MGIPWQQPQPQRSHQSSVPDRRKRDLHERDLHERNLHEEEELPSTSSFPSVEPAEQAELFRDVLVALESSTPAFAGLQKISICS